MLYQVVCLMLAVLMVAEARIDEEPKCSNYHFQEKVLEKLVRLEHKVQVWDDKMAKQISDLNQIKADLATPTVVFKARSVADTTPSAGNLIRYTQAVTNIGGGYDAGTGYFVAPHAGTYLFTVLICAKGSSHVYVHIVAADIVIGATTQYNAGGTPCTTGTGVAVLVKADKVWIKCSAGGFIYEDNYRWESFSGVLIHTNTN